MKIQYERNQSTVLVCTHGSKKKKGTCKGRGSVAILKQLKKELSKRDLKKAVKVRAVGCLGCCKCGPNLVGYPDGLLYTRVEKDDVKKIAAGLADQVAAAARRPRQRVRRVASDA